jgi:hypothetical protein
MHLISAKKPGSKEASHIEDGEANPTVLMKRQFIDGNKLKKGWVIQHFPDTKSSCKKSCSLLTYENYIHLVNLFFPGHAVQTLG